MKGILKILLFTILPYVGWSQKYDTINYKKNIVDLRNSTFPDTIVEKWKSIFITEEMDTLSRDFRYRYVSGVGVIIEETNYVNGRVNGISITYHTNGNIFSMIYYLDDKPWEAMYLADSSGHRYFPGTLANGSGTKVLIDVGGNDLGFITYKNGNTDGEFYQIDGKGGSAKKGELLYREEFIKKDTITVVNFINKNNDTLCAFLFNGIGNDSVSNNFLKQKKSKTIKILKETEILDLSSKENKYLNIFLNAGVVPVGEWRWFSSKENETFVIFRFNRVGKLEKMTNYAQKLVTEFNEDGSVRAEYKIPN